MLNRFMQSRLRGLVILALILIILPAFLGNPFHYELGVVSCRISTIFGDAQITNTILHTG